MKFSDFNVVIGGKDVIKIEFLTSDFVPGNSILQLNVSEMVEHEVGLMRSSINFIVTERTVNGNKLKVTAKQYGYYGRNSEEYNRVDPIKLVKADKSIILVTGEDEKRIRDSACYL